MIVSALMAAAMFVSCGSSAPKKPRGIILQEGDPATVTQADGFTTIEFPATLTQEQRDFYDTDILGYLLKSNGPISTHTTSTTTCTTQGSGCIRVSTRILMRWRYSA